MQAFITKGFNRKKPGLKTLAIGFMPLVLVMVFAACGSEAYYEEFRVVEQEIWHMHDIKEFDVHIHDTTASYRLIVSIRNTTDYDYSNLYMFLTTIHPNQTALRDTIECMLADRHGRWLGRGVGKVRESRFLIKDQFSFPDTGNYLFTIEQAMRDETLEGIIDVGLRIEKNILTQ